MRRPSLATPRPGPRPGRTARIPPRPMALASAIPCRARRGHPPLPPAASNPAPPLCARCAAPHWAVAAGSHVIARLMRGRAKREGAAARALPWPRVVIRRTPALTHVHACMLLPAAGPARRRARPRAAPGAARPQIRPCRRRAAPAWRRRDALSARCHLARRAAARATPRLPHPRRRRRRPAPRTALCGAAAPPSSGLPSLTPGRLPSLIPPPPRRVPPDPPTSSLTCSGVPPPTPGSAPANLCGAARSPPPKRGGSPPPQTPGRPRPRHEPSLLCSGRHPNTHGGRAPASYLLLTYPRSLN
ncbi:MAG: hypothetical protein J3K34DRAFT_238572 [Monoraphidium minutum]|nr:MAG: hypothetical protein J3K34DRAFT_238572 [Monoraphidium minutum]